MTTRLPWVLFTLSFLLNLFVLTGFVYRTWIAPPRFEHRMPAPPPGGRPSLFSSLAHDLDFDDKQREAMKVLVDANASSRQQHFRDLQQLREEFLAELRRPQPDVAHLDQLSDRTQALRGEQQKAFFHMLAQLAPVLRPDQRERLQTIIAERMGPRPSGGPGGGPPGSGPGPGPGRPPQ
jgi:Spy/CpxP family protein refolding chaperone